MILVVLSLSRFPLIRFQCLLKVVPCDIDSKEDERDHGKPGNIL